MTPNNVNAGLLFAAATAMVLMFVLLPLVRRGPRRRGLPGLDSGAGVRYQEVEEQRAAAIDALRDLEFEHRLGNLTDEDYLRLKERYTRRAVALLQQAEAAERSLDDEIEQAVRALRGTAGYRPAAAYRNGASTAPHHDTETGGDGALTCPACGRSLNAGDRFCPACGHSQDTPTTAPAARPRRAAASTVADIPARPAAPKPRAAGIQRWVIGSVAAAAVFAVAVAGSYFALRADAGAPTPVGQVTVQHIHSLFVPAGQSKTVLLSHHDGIMRSADSGKTWAPLTGAQNGRDVMGMVSHPSAPGTVVIAGHDILMKSADGGATFERLQNNLPGLDIHALGGHPNEPQTLYASVINHGLYRSDDGGSGWTFVGNGLPDTALGLTVMPGPPDTLFAATEDQGVLASHDGGKTWVNASGFVNGALPTRNVFAIVGDPRSGDSFSAGGGAVFRGALYIATDAGAFKSTDGGQSWNRLPLNTDVTALALDPSDTTSLYAANSKGEIFHSPDRGITWRPQR